MMIPERQTGSGGDQARGFAEHGHRVGIPGTQTRRTGLLGDQSQGPLRSGNGVVSSGGSAKASLPTLRVGKEAFTDT
ncbi:hypothetical protein H074_08476 [Amycolatopsis decaplanina DSM 44594]|uniref:Uncharacterized protein n=1 Tax=Amycolatopsis decaplanina DSM 44594 TaxID=1284240 RepID=M2YLJ8_9PSEU|nr:hypothetical protein H074_08476 [Amycolatopsis decaplanina DSM 44594]